jgi:hypothetical protein
MLVACVVVDVDCDAAQRGNFGGELVEARVVLSGVCKSRGKGRLVGRHTVRVRRLGTWWRCAPGRVGCGEVAWGLWCGPCVGRCFVGVTEGFRNVLARGGVILLFRCLEFRC